MASEDRPEAPRTIRIADLIGSKVVTADGRKLGRVVDLQLSPGPTYRLTGVVYGRYGWLSRLHVLHLVERFLGDRAKACNLPWEAVDRFEGFKVTLKRGGEGAAAPEGGEGGRPR